MPMSPRLLRPIASRLTLPTDADARAYVLAVNEADGQPLEATVVQAIDNFVIGCKSDGIWDAIKVSCILAGARTLAGALVPLRGGAPTNNNFVSGDYTRGGATPGLVGNGTTKYLNSNRNNNADPQDDNHNAVYASILPSTAGFAETLIGSDGTGVTGSNVIIHVQGSVAPNGRISTRSRSAAIADTFTVSAGLIGTSRASNAAYTLRKNQANTVISEASDGIDANDVLIFRRGNASATYTSARIAFYSIGESLDLAALDTRVSALITAIGAAI